MRASQDSMTPLSADHTYYNMPWETRKYLSVEWVQDCIQVWDERSWTSEEAWAVEAFTIGEGIPELLLAAKFRTIQEWWQEVAPHGSSPGNSAYITFLCVMLQIHLSGQEYGQKLARSTSDYQGQVTTKTFNESSDLSTRPAEILFDAPVSRRNEISSHISKTEPYDDPTSYMVSLSTDRLTRVEHQRELGIPLSAALGRPREDCPPRTTGSCKSHIQAEINVGSQCMDHIEEPPTTYIPSAGKPKRCRRSAPPRLRTSNIDHTWTDTLSSRKIIPAIHEADVLRTFEGHKAHESRSRELDHSRGGVSSSRVLLPIDVNRVTPGFCIPMSLPQTRPELPLRANSEGVLRRGTPIIVGACGLSGCPGHGTQFPRPCEPRQDSVGNAGPELELPLALTFVKSELILNSESAVLAQPPNKQKKRRKVKLEEVDTRPDLPSARRPLIWSATRQELCESTPWFKSYQSGVYQKDDIVRGYLLGGFGSSGDRFLDDGRLIISHGGGKNELSARDAANQSSSDPSVRALIKTWKQGLPIVLIADDNFRGFPFNLKSAGFGYAVLGSYMIVEAWPQKQVCGSDNSNVIRWLFAFRWCKSQGNPWWQAPLSYRITSQWDATLMTESYLPSVKHDRANSETGIVKCPQCLVAFPQVYTVWTCLNTSCPMFDVIEGRNIPAEQREYNIEHLIRVPTWEGHIDSVDKSLTQPITSSHSPSTSAIFKQGFYCQPCGRLSSRYKWEEWECRVCANKQAIQGKLQTASDLCLRSRGDSFNIDSPNDVQLIHEFSPEQNIHIRTFRFGVSDNHVAKVHVISSIGASLADTIFEHYQDTACESDMFRRYSKHNFKMLKGELLSNYFSHNAGEPYQYASGDKQTVSLDKSPPAVQAALEYIKEKARVVLGHLPELNEVLSAAYLEEQKMSFHSDDEKGLGPIVAALSLGSPAVMQYRPVPCAGRHSKQKQKKATLLTLELRHGDVIVMEGRDVQKFYQHAVTPVGFRIAATARYIEPAKAPLPDKKE